MSNDQCVDIVYVGLAWEASQGFTLEQGFEAMSRDGTIRASNKEWNNRLSRANVTQIKVLSDAAKAKICRDTGNGKYSDRGDAKEPPLMAPVTDATQYSRWCSFCNDFRDLLLLCAGCRVALCSSDVNSMRGCVPWNISMDRKDFIFLCPYCAGSNADGGPSTLVFRVTGTLRKKWDIPFRHAPAVLIVSIRYSKKSHSFGKLLRDHLNLSYGNNEESVMLVEQAVDSTVRHDDDGRFTWSNDTSLAEEFLNAHKSAKIVVAIDTHSADNGYFIWTGSTAETYRACSLLEILRDCSPKGIFKYLSNAEDTPIHSHKSLIINLACGQSISQDRARSELLNGHCADAVLSLAKDANLVGDISGTLLDLTAGWVQTLSDYNVLMARFIKMSWASNHLPILSRHGHDTTRFTTFFIDNVPQPVPDAARPDSNDHVLFTGFSMGSPGGMVVRCPIVDHQGIGIKQTKGAVRITCEECLSKCTVPQFRSDPTSPLKTQGLVAINYPPAQYPIQWELSPKALQTNAKISWAETPMPDTPPPLQGPREQPTIRISCLDTVIRSASLPSSTTVTPRPSSSNLRIRIPARQSTPNLRLPQSTRDNGSHSNNSTPPLQSPQESVEARKRAFEESTSGIWVRRRRSKNQ
ncbi:hypothetical protein BJ322DRAFT_1113387 [Thelephora terrestris]|uniref:Uncharacterized protein n=1 Tax=Thelephora terrestris TaxID=56493 RepID=A0A9P6H513_9AGAM|nr:hypothetical protein BJ322DRAFT_1113387 [Thelephora terrestris]